MKYISCRHIEHGISFFSNSVQICCISSHIGGGNISQIDNYKGEPIDWQNLFKIRREMRESHKAGIINPRCVGCYYLNKQKWNQNDYFDEVLIGHWTHCNCKCTYCYTEADKEYFNSRESYNILPIIKDMIEKKALNPNGIITFGGGEPTILSEFEDLVNLLLDYDMKNIRIHSSGIKYSPAIEKGLELGKITLIVSIDSSDPVAYQQIKQVPCFEKVWENLRKYARANGLIRTKYVIVPGVNDYLDSIKKWLAMTSGAGIKDIAFDVEDSWFKENRSNIPQYMYELVDYIWDHYTEYGIRSCELYERASNLRKDRQERPKLSQGEL